MMLLRAFAMRHRAMALLLVVAALGMKALGMKALVPAGMMVSTASNGEARTAGHVLVHLSGHWLVQEGVRLDAGIENLFDRRYVEHPAAAEAGDNDAVAAGPQGG